MPMPSADICMPRPPSFGSEGWEADSARASCKECVLLRCGEGRCVGLGMCCCCCCCWTSDSCEPDSIVPPPPPAAPAPPAAPELYWKVLPAAARGLCEGEENMAAESAGCVAGCSGTVEAGLETFCSSWKRRNILGDCKVPDPDPLAPPRPAFPRGWVANCGQKLMATACCKVAMAELPAAWAPEGEEEKRLLAPCREGVMDMARGRCRSTWQSQAKVILDIS